MRYHWGLGIGHTYSHGQTMPSQKYPMAEAPAEPAIEVHEDSDEDPADSLAPCSTQVFAGPDGKAPQVEHDDSDLEPEDFEPLEDEDEDVDVDSTGSQAESADSEDSDFDARRDSDGDDEDYLELHNTYHSD